MSQRAIAEIDRNLAALLADSTESNAREFLRTELLADSTESNTWGVTSVNAADRLEQRMRLISEVSTRIKSQTTAKELNTQPLAVLELSLSDLWKAYIPLALMLYDEYVKFRQSNDTTWVVGINAPPGSGKSTLVQILKLLMEVVAGKELNVAQVGSDDLYMGKSQREAAGYVTRLDPRTLDVDFFHVIADLKELKDGKVKVPRFDKGMDERDGFNEIEGPLDILFYEGWRVGVRKSDFTLPNGDLVKFDYERLNAPIDYLMYLDADPEDVWHWKLNSSQQDHEKMKGKKVDWKPWGDSDTTQLRQKWDEWMLPFLKHHEARLLKDEKTKFVLTKNDAHHIVKTSFNNRNRLRSAFKKANVTLDLESSANSSLSKEDAFVLHAEEVMLSPGNVRATLQRSRCRIESTQLPLPASGSKCAVVDATGDATLAKSVGGA